MSVELLDKTRKIGMLLHNNNSSKVVFNDICAVLTQTLSSSALVISKKGKLLGLSHDLLVGDIAGMMVDGVGGFLDGAMNERLLSVLSTKENVNLETLGFAPKEIEGYFAIITPINIAGERFGTLFVYRENEPYGIDDIILCEYGCTVVGLEMLRSENEETAEEERKKHIAKSALQTLSFTEQEAVAEVFTELSGSEGLLVASKIADRAGITRSVIVNALHKLISADVIESKSAGMKGTYVKVRNEYIFDELAALHKRSFEE